MLPLVQPIHNREVIDMSRNNSCGYCMVLVPFFLVLVLGLACREAPMVDPAAHVWTCITDTECETEAAKLGLDID